MNHREATLTLAAWFGVGVFAAMVVLAAPRTDWDGAVLYGVGNSFGIFLGFPVFRRLGAGLRSRFAGGMAYPLLVGGSAGAAAVAGVWGSLNDPPGIPGLPGTDDLVGAVILGLWNALVLGLGFGHRFAGSERAGSTEAPT